MNRKTYQKQVGFGTKLALSLLLIGALPAVMVAQGAAAPAEPTVQLGQEFVSNLRWILACLVLILIFVAYIAVVASAKDAYSISLRRILDSVTGKGSKDEAMDHSYDGLVELNNPMPYWLQLLFWGTIVFGGIYMAYYHVFKAGPLQDEMYANEVALANETYKNVELTDDQLVLISDQSQLANAKGIYDANCVQCHGGKGEGGVGPNLTDAYWIHGGSVKEVYNTITVGVPAKGMISWSDKVSSQDRLALASYILGLQGTNPPNAKAPEGVMAGEVAPTDSSAVPPVDSAAVDSGAAPAVDHGGK